MEAFIVQKDKISTNTVFYFSDSEQKIFFWRCFLFGNAVFF